MCTSTWIRCAGWYSLAIAALVLAGCDSGPKRYHVSGQATFEGKLIPLGVILFQSEAGGPEAADAGGFAHIKDGWYDTRNHGKGVVGGPYRVQIQGFDGKPPPNVDMPFGVPLFPDYTTTVDFPKEDTTRDFDVPARGKSQRSSP